MNTRYCSITSMAANGGAIPSTDAEVAEVAHALNETSDTE